MPEIVYTTPLVKQPKVSILVPIFNVEKYLRECLDSVVGQTLKEVEIICIDDGSTDSSPKIIKEYAAKDPRIVVITKKNSGYGDSMNKGLAKARGEYIGIVESDDWAEKDMFKDLYELAKRHRVEVVKSNYYSYYSDLTEKSPQWNDELGAVFNTEQRRVITDKNTLFQLIPEQDAGEVINPREKQAIFYCKPAIWTAIYETEFLKKNKIDFLPTPGASYQDTAFNFKVWACATRVFFTKEAYLHYRLDNEASSVNNPGKVFCVSDEYKEIERFLKANKLDTILGSLSQITKFGGYIWNFNRLKDGLDEEFLPLFSKEYVAADKSGQIDYVYFDLNRRRDLREIIADPDMFLARKRAREKAKVSVIVAVYNTERYLRKCLDSIVNQTLKDIEIICVNDGSHDDSLSILTEYWSKDPRITIYDQTNQGLSVVRNKGMRMASSNFYTFVDSDDFLDPAICEKLYTAVTKNKCDIAICGANVVYTGQTSTDFRRSDDEYFRHKYRGKVKISDAVIKSTDVVAWNKIYRASIQRRYDIYFPRGLLYEDAKFYNDFMILAKSAYYLDEKLYNYVRNGDGIMGATARKNPRAIDHVRVVIESFKFMKDRDLFDKHTQLFLHNFIEYFRLARRLMPTNDLPKLYDLAEKFLRDYGSYLNSFDKSLVPAISKLLPRVSAATRLKRGVRNRLKRPARAVLSKVSLGYRAQRIILPAIAAIDRKLDYTNKSTSEQLESLTAKIEQLQDELDKLRK